MEEGRRGKVERGRREKRVSEYPFLGGLGLIWV